MTERTLTPDGTSGLPVSLLRSWVEVLAAPRRFFRGKILPGEQAPGLLFAMGVVLVSELLRVTVTNDPYPVLGGRPILSVGFWIALAVLFAAPAALHLIAALQTVLLIVLTDDRAGVSETVQVLGYACAPCVLARVPSPEIRAVVGIYAAILLFIGLSEVHEISTERGILAGIVPAALAFGYGFGAFDAITTLLAQWYII